ncbi:MAG: signal peptidase I [Luteibaculaceae bacterium]|jgi:signal peptidase I
MTIPYIFLLLTLLGHILFLPAFFEKAGQDKWKGYIPFLNYFVWTKIVEKPWWWVLILIVPGVNLLMFVVFHLELASAFNKRSAKDHWSIGLLPFVFMFLWSREEDLSFQGPIDWKARKKPMYKEWLDAIVFATIAATIIRTFLIEAYTIPTPSMEKSMMVGDYLFVSKASYGPKLPNTPVAFPFAHHTLPLTEKTPSYLEWFQLPYFRLPGFGDVERMDAVVFNFPEGDTVCSNFQEVSYYQLVRDYGEKAVKNNKIVNQKTGRKAFGELLVRPVDKKENYIKRCVGLPGETLEVKEGILWVNGEQVEMPDEMQYAYNIRTNQKINTVFFKEQFDVTPTDIQFNQGSGMYNMPLSAEKAGLIGKLDIIDTIYREINYPGERSDANTVIFPNHYSVNWTEDVFGPLYIPKEGETITLTDENKVLYKRVIAIYENNVFSEKGGDFYIDGTKIEEYTFKQNYFWMMGDNRHRSADSRFWGFVPEDHVVGKALFIWFSKDPITGIRWDRIFNLVK